MPRRAVLLYTVALAALAGCAGREAMRDRQAAARTSVGRAALFVDREAYVAQPFAGAAEDPRTGADSRRYRFRIRATFVNRRSRPIYMARCSPTDPYPEYGFAYVGRDSLVEDPHLPFGRAWAAYTPGWSCSAHDRPIVVPPGGVHRAVLDVEGPNGFDGPSGEPIGRVAGPFRLSYPASLCPGAGARRRPECALPPRERLSQVFEVRPAP